MEADLSLVKRELTIGQPLETQTYPVAHLITLPMELKTMIWNCLTALITAEYQNIWSAKTKPSHILNITLVCRQLYHETHLKLFYSIDWFQYIFSGFTPFVSSDDTLSRRAVIGTSKGKLRDYIKGYMKSRDTFLKRNNVLSQKFSTVQLGAITKFEIGPHFNRLLTSLNTASHFSTPALCYLIGFMPNLVKLHFDIDCRDKSITYLGSDFEWRKQDKDNSTWLMVSVTQFATNHEPQRELFSLQIPSQFTQQDWYIGNSGKKWSILAACGVQLQADPSSLTHSLWFMREDYELSLQLARADCYRVAEHPLYRLHIEDGHGHERVLNISLTMQNLHNDVKLRWIQHGSRFGMIKAGFATDSDPIGSGN